MKPSKTRVNIAREAARLIRESPDLRHSDARRLAAERICPQGAMRRDLPTDEEVREQVLAIGRAGEQVVWENRFELYERLLRPLADVQQNPATHPEGDALYHSLQVYSLVERRLPYDEEVLSAALLHDIGKAIDRRNHVEAGLAALAGMITPRTEWLIENLPVAHELAIGTLGARARKRLASAPDCDELSLLCECDRDGRKRGVGVVDLDDAIDNLRALSAENDS